MTAQQFNDDLRKGKTPNERWKHITEELNYFMPAPVTDEDWAKLLYVRDVKKISRKSGITYKGLNYKGEAFSALVNRLGEVDVTVLADPEDYRFLYVHLGPDKALIELTEQYVDERSPAYPLEDYKRRLAEKKAELVEHEDARKFREDVQQASTVKKRPPARKSTARNRATTAIHKDSEAHQRAVAKPVKSRTVAEQTPTTEATANVPVFSFDAIPAMPVYDHKTGTLKS